MPEPEKQGFSFPQDVEDYLRGGRQTGPKLGPDFGKPPNLPIGMEDYDPRNFFQILAEDNPYLLYDMQIRDWFQEKLKEIGAGVWKGKQLADVFGQYAKPDEKGNPATEWDVLDRILNEVKLRGEAGMPIESMPFYKESRNSIGPNFYDYYNQKLIEEVQLKEQLLDKYIPQSAGGRQQLYQGVQQGIVTPEEAWGSAPQHYGGVETAPATETPWSEWQNQMAEQENRQTQRPLSSTQQNLMVYLQKLQQAGADPAQIQDLAQYLDPQMNNFPGWEGIQARALSQAGNILTELETRKNTQASTLYSTLYPDLYKQYQGTGLAAETRPGAPKQYFSQWLNEPDQQKMATDYETKMAEQYGPGWDLYKNYIGEWLPTRGTEQEKPLEQLPEWWPKQQEYKDWERRRALKMGAGQARVAPSARIG